MKPAKANELNTNTNTTQTAAVVVARAAASVSKRPLCVPAATTVAVCVDTTVEAPPSTSSAPVLQVKIKVAADRSHDIVTLQSGLRYYFPHWLSSLELAIRTYRKYSDAVWAKTATAEQCRIARGAYEWLCDCGVPDGTRADFERALNVIENEILPRLRLAPDSPAARTRCRVCGSEIWGRESLVTGVGSGCRNDRGKKTGNGR